MSESKVFMFPDSVGQTHNSIDPNLWLALNQNGGFGNGNGWWILFLFLLWGRNGYGFNDLNGSGTGYLSNQITNGAGRDLLMQAINGNGSAISNLATNLNCDANSIKTAINALQSSVCQVGNQVGMSAADVKNAITTGNMNLTQQLAQCCCDNKLLVTTQGYENQIATLNQTNALTSRIDQLANGITQGFSATAYETAQQTCALRENADNNARSILAKLDQIEDSRKDREIAALTAQLTASTSRAERAAELAPINKALNDIQCKQPNTVTVPYQPFVTVPNCVAWNATYGTLPYQQNGSIWS